MTPLEVIVLGILGPLAVGVGLVALLADPKWGRAARPDSGEGHDWPMIPPSYDYMCLVEEQRWHDAQKRREAKEREMARHRAIYAPRQEAHIKRARKKP